MSPLHSAATGSFYLPNAQLGSHTKQVLDSTRNSSNGSPLLVISSISISILNCVPPDWGIRRVLNMCFLKWLRSLNLCTALKIKFKMTLSFDQCDLSVFHTHSLPSPYRAQLRSHVSQDALVMYTHIHSHCDFYQFPSYKLSQGITVFFFRASFLAEG